MSLINVQELKDNCANSKLNLNEEMNQYIYHFKNHMSENSEYISKCKKKINV